MASRGHNYGSVSISDTATAILGNYDGRKTNISKLHIENATFLTGDFSHSRDKFSFPDAYAEQNNAVAQRRTRSVYHRPSEVPERTTVIDSNSRGRFFSSLKNGIPSIGSLLGARQLSQNAQSRSAHEQIQSQHNYVQNLKKYIPAGLLVILASRSLSLQDVVQLALRMKDDTILPLAATAGLSFWLASALTSPSCLHQPSSLSGDCLSFCDVYYRVRRVPLAIFEDQEILQAFFKTHYRGTTAESFIVNGQYQVQVSREQGSSEQPKQLSDICSSALSDDWLSMRVIFRVSTVSCIECLNQLHEHNGVFTWYVG